MRWTALATYFKLLDLLDNIIDWPRPGRVPLVVAPWDCAVGHVVGHTFLYCLKCRRATGSRAMVAWWMDVVVWIVVGKKTHEAFEVGWTDGKQLLPSEGRSLTPAVELHLEAVDELHKPTKTRMITLFVRKNPAVVDIIVGLKKN